MKINKDDILGRGGFIADRRKLDPSLDMSYIQYDINLNFYGWEKGKTNLKFAMRELRDSAPRSYAAFFPRIYRNVEDYEWRWANYTSAMHVVSAQVDKQYTEDYDAQRNAVMFAGLWQYTGLNQFFVSRPLYDAVSHTTPPSDMDFDDFKMPHDALMFQLPSGVMKFRDSDCTHIGVARFETGQYTIPGKITEIKVNANRAKFIFTTAIKDQSMFFAVGADSLALKKMLEGGVDILAYTNELSGSRTQPVGEITPDIVMVHDMIRIALNLVLAMEIEPQLVERGRKITLSKKDRHQEIWEPNFVGKKYRTVYTGGVEPGTHSSPRMHWRVGHFRKQGFGVRTAGTCECTHDKNIHFVDKITPRVHMATENFCMHHGCPCFNYTPTKSEFESYKKIWIHPVLVNAKPKEGAKK